MNLEETMTGMIQVGSEFGLVDVYGLITASRYILVLIRCLLEECKYNVKRLGIG